MREKEVLERAFAMPLTSPAYPPGPYRFVNREYLIITYRTDPAKLRAVVPEPLELDQREALVKYEFIRMPDSNGFGDYTESGQVIPVSFRGRKGSYTHCMFLNDEGPIAGGRELWGFPEEARAADAADRDRHAGRNPGLRPASGRDRDDGLQAPRSRPGASQGFARGAELPAQDHSARRRHAAHLRACRIPPRGRHDEGRVDRARGAPPCHLTLWRRSPNCRCSRSCPPSTLLPILRSASARSCMTICGNQVDKRCASTKWPWRLERQSCTRRPVTQPALFALMALRRSAVDVMAVLEPLKRTA